MAVMYEKEIFDDEKFNLNRELIAQKMGQNRQQFELNEVIIRDFNMDMANRGFKIVTKGNAKSIIESLKKWKDKQKIFNCMVQCSFL